MGVLFVLRLEINIKQDELYGGFIVGGAHLRVQGDVYKLCPNFPAHLKSSKERIYDSSTRITIGYQCMK